MNNQAHRTTFPSPSPERLERAVGVLRHYRKHTNHAWLRELCKRKEREAIQDLISQITAERRAAVPRQVRA